ncbi:MAG: phage tail fiber protein [Bacillota bacterium]
MPITRYLRKKINDYIFGNTAYTPPATIYAGILVNIAAVDGSYTEATYTGYARIAIANNKTSFSVSSDVDETQITNNVEIYFNTHEGGTSVSVTNIGYFDAPTGGNLLAYAPYVKILEVSDRLVIPVAGLVITHKNI